MVGELLDGDPHPGLENRETWGTRPSREQTCA
jgi:hypothetical protein